MSKRSNGWEGTMVFVQKSSHYGCDFRSFVSRLLQSIRGMRLHIQICGSRAFVLHLFLQHHKHPGNKPSCAAVASTRFYSSSLSKSVSKEHKWRAAFSVNYLPSIVCCAQQSISRCVYPCPRCCATNGACWRSNCDSTDYDDRDLMRFRVSHSKKRSPS